MPKDRSGLALFIFSFFGIDPGSEGRPERCTGGALYLIIIENQKRKNSLSLMLSGSMVMKSFIFLSQKD